MWQDNITLVIFGSLRPQESREVEIFKGRLREEYGAKLLALETQHKGGRQVCLVVLRYFRGGNYHSGIHMIYDNEIFWFPDFNWLTIGYLLLMNKSWDLTFSGAHHKNHKREIGTHPSQGKWLFMVWRGGGEGILCTGRISFLLDIYVILVPVPFSAYSFHFYHSLIRWSDGMRCCRSDFIYFVVSANRDIFGRFLSFSISLFGVSDYSVRD